METADLIGKTRSTEPVLRIAPRPPDFCDQVGDGGGWSDLPVNMETGDSLEPIAIQLAGGARWVAEATSALFLDCEGCDAVEELEPRRDEGEAAMS
jgi:hypothetical protein